MVLTATQDIVMTAKEAGNFSTLLKAAKAAHMLDTLKGDGPFTVFAPTDDAFDEIPESDLQDLLKDPEALRSVLKHHVVPGLFMKSDLAELEEIDTLEGTKHCCSSCGDLLVKADIECSNGVIHAINKVLMPQESQSSSSDSSCSGGSSKSGKSPK